MKIKHLALAATVLLLGCASLRAQTPEEIVRNMSAQLDRADTEGFSMDMVMKIPVLGTMRSHTLISGNKSKTMMSSKDKNYTLWTDGDTNWMYDPASNEITIDNNRKNATSSSDDGSSLSSFDSITDGYDLELQEETSDAWVILCKKKKTNKDKDDPKKMTLAVSKATNLPLYMRMKQSVVSVSMENVAIGVSEASVTFNPAEYPNAKIIDKR